MSVRTDFAYCSLISSSPTLLLSSATNTHRRILTPIPPGVYLMIDSRSPAANDEDEDEDDDGESAAGFFLGSCVKPAAPPN